MNCIANNKFRCKCKHLLTKKQIIRQNIHQNSIFWPEKFYFREFFSTFGPKINHFETKIT